MSKEATGWGDPHPAMTDDILEWVLTQVSIADSWLPHMRVMLRDYLKRAEAEGGRRLWVSVGPTGVELSHQTPENDDR